jgi:hypothetical protein
LRLLILPCSGFLVVTIMKKSIVLVYDCNKEAENICMK